MSREDDVETSVERADPLVGTIFDKRFRVEERIAAGGFGAIYRATHVKSGHQIALKVLLPALARDLGILARFRREGDTLTALRNPHTITAYELGQATDKTLFIVLELLYGESLFERYKANGPFEWKRIVKIAREVCESLEEAHAMGIVHRDLKPTNIHLEQKGDDIDYVKVLDFGIAKILGAGAADLTNAGQMIGTIDYMSPEQMVGGNVTGQSDLYTLGVVMYEMIAGTPPFGESLTAAQALAAVMQSKPEPLYLRAPVPEELDRIVMRCLERELHRRYQTVAELRLDLARLLAGIVHPRVLADTKPTVTVDDELTQFTPPPQLMADARGTDWSVAESTALIPPSAQLLAASRRAKRPTADEPTQFTPPPEQLIADSRRPARPADYEATQLTPPLEKLLAESRGDEWTDDDEHAPTSSRRPRRSEANNRVTAVARLADIAERAAMTRAPASDRAATVRRGDATVPRVAASERAMTVPRVDASERAMTVPRTASPHAAALRDSDSGLDAPTPPIEISKAASARPTSPDQVATVAFPRAQAGDQVATTAFARPDSQPDTVAFPRAGAQPDAATKAFSRRADSSPGPASGPAAHKAGTLPPPIPPTPRKPPSGPPPSVLPPPRTVTPLPFAQTELAVPRTLTPSALSATEPAVPRTLTPQTPIPQLVAAPFSTAPPPAVEPYMPVVAPVAPPPGPPPTTRSFELARMAAREAAIRRLIWIVVLVAALGLGAILATQL